MRGHDVRWYAGPEYARKLEALGMRYFPYRRATEVTAGNIATLFPERARLKGPKLISFDLEKFFAANVDNHFQDIVEIRNEFPFDILICDGAVYAEKLVAEVLGVPVFAVGLTTVMPDHQSPPPFFGLRPARTVVGRTVHRVVRRMLASTMRAGVSSTTKSSRAMASRRSHSTGSRTRRSPAPAACSSTARRASSFPGYRPPDNAEFVGPLVPARAALGPDTPLPAAVLASGARVVAVSQGTVDNADPNKLIVSTLEALKDGPYVVVATTGGVRTDELRERFAAPNVVIEDFINYDDLFPHVNVFVTNGGFGSVLAAMRHGVPVVAAGTARARTTSMRASAGTGLGVDLRSERPSPARIRAAVRRVLGDPTYAANVSKLRAELDSYDPMARIEAALHAKQITAQS